MKGQSPEHLRRMNRTPSHTCPTLCPASSVPTQDPSGLAPPPPCVYSGRTRNRTWPQSKPTTVSTTRLRCHPDCSPRDWQWPGFPLGGGLYRGSSLAQSCPAGVQAFGSSFFPCGLGQECGGRAWGSCGEGCDFPEMLRLVPTLAWVQGRERKRTGAREPLRWLHSESHIPAGGRHRTNGPEKGKEAKAISVAASLEVWAGNNLLRPPFPLSPKRVSGQQ